MHLFIFLIKHKLFLTIKTFKKHYKIKIMRISAQNQFL